jgi:hypothetical protein
MALPASLLEATGLSVVPFVSTQCHAEGLCGHFVGGRDNIFLLIA